jgi:hypothetical protein
VLIVVNGGELWERWGEAQVFGNSLSLLYSTVHQAQILLQLLYTALHVQLDLFQHQIQPFAKGKLDIALMRIAHRPHAPVRSLVNGKVEL